MPSLLYCHFLAVGSRRRRSKQQCLAPEPPTISSLGPHSLGSYASLPFPPSQEQECLQVSSPDPLPSSLGNNCPLQQQGLLGFCQVTCFQELEPHPVLSSD